MEKKFINTTINFFNTLVYFDPIVLQNKSVEEVILYGLDAYTKIEGCTSAVLFVLNPAFFDFQFKVCSDKAEKQVFENWFKMLIESGGVAKALSSGMLDWYITDEGNKMRFLIIPLIVPTGISGLVIVKLNDSFKNDEGELNLIKLYSNYLSMLIYDIDDTKRPKSINENFEQSIKINPDDIIQSTRELKLILDSVQAGIIIIDKKTNRTADANEAAAALTGYSKEEIIGLEKDFLFLSKHPDITLGSLVSNQEALLKKNNGKIVPVIMTAADVQLGGDDFVILTFLDITERKKMENDLQEARDLLEQRVEDRTRELSKTNEELQEQIRKRIMVEEENMKLYWAVQQSPVAIIITDLSGKIEYVNPRFNEITGYELDEVIGKSHKILDPEIITQEENNSFWEAFAKRCKWHGEYMNKRKDGSLVWVSSIICPIENLSGDIFHFLIVQEDISERKKAEQELIAAKQRAEESDKLKSIILANMQHEFRTPLIGIHGYSQILIEEINNAEQRSMLENIQFSGKRLMNTLNNVLAMSQFESDRMELKLKEYNLSEQISHIVNYFKIAAEEKGLEFILKTNENIKAKYDPEMLANAVSYLLDNAIKFTITGSVSVVVDICSEDGKNWAVIKIMDTGVGIDESQQMKIFSPFRQASEGLSRSYEGTGLGLTLAKKMIESMNGKITLESKSHEGSKFTLWLQV